jgi:hypothetical protein
MSYYTCSGKSFVQVTQRFFSKKGVEKDGKSFLLGREYEGEVVLAIFDTKEEARQACNVLDNLLVNTYFSVCEFDEDVEALRKNPVKSIFQGS